MMPEEGSGNPPHFKLGPQGGFKRNSHQKQKWSSNHIPVGKTDLARKIYSVEWLLKRRDVKETQESNFDIPEPLNMRLHSPTSQRRRYPFFSTPSRYGSGHNKEDEEKPAWMEESAENLKLDFNFKVLGKDDKQHWEKFGKVKDAGDIRVLTIADYEKHEKKENESAQQRRSTENDAQFMMNPLTQNDIMQAFSGLSHGQSGVDNDEPFNPDNLFAAAPAPASSSSRVIEKEPVMNQVEHDVNLRAPPKNKVMPQKQTQPKQMSSEKKNFLYSLMKGNGPGKSSAEKSVKPIQPPSMIYASDLEHEQVQKKVAAANAAAKRKNPTPISRPNASEIRSGLVQPIQPRHPTKQPISQEIPQQTYQQRFSNSSLKESEKVKLTQMLHEKLKKYSVPPSQLAYASRSASKALKVELEGLGYSLVPSLNLMDTKCSKNEKAILSFQHEIRKRYQIAIFRANEEASKYRAYCLKRNQKKLMH